jgi:transcriptional regulator with XRE-family HTH domain
MGARLREKRIELGVSLRELARKLEVSPSLVSQIETGKIQPSVRTLYAIVSQLGMSLDAIFDLTAEAGPRGRGAAPAPVAAPTGGEAAEALSHGRVQRAADRRTIALESGVHWERLTAWDDPDVEFLMAVYEVGGSSSSDRKLMRHSGREFGLVISGSLSVTVGFEEHVLGPGDSMSFESTVPHRLHNEGDEPVRAVWVTLDRHRAP